jgi:hypothetical protein
MSSLYVLIKGHNSGPGPDQSRVEPWGQAAPQGLMRQERRAKKRATAGMGVKGEHRDEEPSNVRAFQNAHLCDPGDIPTGNQPWQPIVTRKPIRVD